MKSKHQLLLLMMALLSPWAAMGQETITLTGDVTKTIQIGTNYTFYDSGGPIGDYGNSENYTATFNCLGSITINFSQFATEPSADCYRYDYMRIYDGDVETGTLLARGQTDCFSNPLTLNTDIVAQSGTMTVVWISDRYTTAAGWIATITGSATNCCPKPIVTLNDVTSTSLTFQWEGDDACQTTVLDATTNEQVYVGSGAINPLTVEGLSPNTDYTLEVRTVCEPECGNELSDPVIIGVRTACEAMTITEPWSENFDSYSGTSYHYPTNNLPHCWNYINTDSDVSLQGYPVVYDNSEQSYSGNNHLRFYSYYCTNTNAPYGVNIPQDQYAILPQMENVSNLRMNFYARVLYNDSDATFHVGVMTNPADITTFSEVATYTVASTTYEPYTIPFSTYTGTGTYIAIMLEKAKRPEYSIGASYSCVLIDNLVVEPIHFSSFTKDIIGYGTGESNWYLIASPLAEDVSPEAVGMMITDDNTDSDNYTYDLYRFDQTQSDEWRNYRSATFNLANGTGYLYANKNDVTLTFAGIPYFGDSKMVILRNNTGNNTTTHFAGYNLVGNPFTVNAYIGNRDFYVMNGGTEIILADRVEGGGAEYIEPMEGIFVIATTNNEPIIFTTTAPGSRSASLSLNVSQNRGVVDRAMVRFGEDRTLPKFQLRDSSTKVYIPQDNIDYAVVNAEAMGELPVNFRAEENSSYTLSFTSEEVSFSYLHLVDNMTGTDVDLLANPSYTFTAKTTDYESRFKLVFVCEDANGDSETFAFISNGNIIVNGTGTLQVIDLLGRQLSSQEIHSSFGIPHLAFPTGVYVLRLINGNVVKTQKIVLR